MGVMAARQSQIGRIRVEIVTAGGAVVLRIGELDITGPSRHQVSHVVKETLDASQSVGASATTWARAAFVVPATCNDPGLGQVFDTRNSLCNVGKVFTGSRHGDVLQKKVCSPGYIGKSSPQR